MIARRLLDRILSMMTDSPGPGTAPTSPHPADASSAFEPRVADVLAVRAMLRKRLPPEIISNIIDAAEYWPHTTSTFNAGGADPSVSAGGLLGWRDVLRASGGRPDDENKLVIRTPPLGILSAHRDWPATSWSLATARPQVLHLDPPRPLDAEFDAEDFVRASGVPADVGLLQHPCRKIVWHIRSHDQGHSGEPAQYKGTYERSYTWFEAGVERCNRRPPAEGEAHGPPRPSFDLATPGDVVLVQPELAWDAAAGRARHPLYSPERLLVQYNMHAKADFTEHEITWSLYDDILDPDSERADKELRLKGRGVETGNGQFVRDLKLGDMVTLWAKARFMAWTNVVQKATVKVYWFV